MSLMSIGFIGAGAISQAILGRLVAAGRTDITISNSRGPATLATLTRRYGPGVRAGTVAEAGAADLVVLAVPWSRVPAALGQVADWAGRVLVDTTNPLEAPTYRMADLGGRTSSEIVADLAPGARVVKGFNTLPPHVLGADPHQAGGRRVIFYSGDHADAKKTFRRILEALGYAGVDLGTLAVGGLLHQFPGGPLPTLNLLQLD